MGKPRRSALASFVVHARTYQYSRTLGSVTFTKGEYGVTDAESQSYIMLDQEYPLALPNI